MTTDEIHLLCIHKPTETMATTVELELRNFPADVQDILKQRAVERCVTIDVIIHDYVLETSKLIKESGAEAIGQEKPTIIKP